MTTTEDTSYQEVLTKFGELKSMNVLQLPHLTRESWNLGLQKGWAVAERGKEQANKYSTAPDTVTRSNTNQVTKPVYTVDLKAEGLAACLPEEQVVYQKPSP